MHISKELGSLLNVNKAKLCNLPILPCFKSLKEVKKQSISLVSGDTELEDEVLVTHTD